MHGTIGPSCAIAWMEGTGSPSTWINRASIPDRTAIAEVLGLPPVQARVSHRPGPGCYGHHSRDDVSADGALIVRAYHDRPIR